MLFMYIYLEGRGTIDALTSQSPPAGFNQGASQMLFRELGRGEGMDSSYLNIIPLYSIFSSHSAIICLILQVQLACTKIDSFFYRGKGGGWDPYKGGRESYPLGEFQGRWK